jgi:methyl-accepting chemotaxis protein
MKLANLRIGTRLALAFGFLCVAFVFMVGQGVTMLGRVNEGTNTIVNMRMPRVEMATHMLGEVNDIAVALRNLLLSDGADDRAQQVEEVVSSRKELDTILAKLDGLLVYPQARAVLAQEMQLNARYTHGQQELIRMIERGDDAGARTYLKTTLRPLLADYKAAIDQQIKIQTDLAMETAQDAQAMYIRTRLLMIVLGAGILAVACALAWWISVSITRPLRRALDVATAVAAGDLTTHVEIDSRCEVGQLLGALQRMNENLAATVGTVRGGTEAIALASGQVAAGNSDLSARTEQQASALEETASTMEELTSTVKQNADNARQANTLAATASDVASKGGAVIERVVDTMAQIHAASSRIADIIGVIDGIAFQTNILALNAAVEAARAGEQGRGFAVVAGEVRSLAHRSAAAAKEIKSLIIDSSDKVDAGSHLVREAGSTMGEIVDSVRRVADILGEITAASREQSDGIEQINQAITQMDGMTQQNAALVEEAAAASQAMRDQAARLADAVAVFRIESGEAAAPARASVPEVAARPVPKSVARPAKAAVKPAQKAPKAATTVEGDWIEF